MLYYHNLSFCDVRLFLIKIFNYFPCFLPFIVLTKRASPNDLELRFFFPIIGTVVGKTIIKKATMYTHESRF